MSGFTVMIKPLRCAGLAATAVLSLFVSACGEQASEQPRDTAALQQKVQEKTRELYRIHLKLDTAAAELEKAEAAIASGNVSAAGYHVTEAHRAVVNADNELLDLGQGLQQAVNLDQ
jgi:hypothetical protein